MTSELITLLDKLTKEMSKYYSGDRPKITFRNNIMIIETGCIINEIPLDHEQKQLVEFFITKFVELRDIIDDYVESNIE